MRNLAILFAAVAAFAITPAIAGGNPNYSTTSESHSTAQMKKDKKMKKGADADVTVREVYNFND